MASVEKPFRIGIVAPGTRLPREVAEAARAVVARHFGERVELIFHPQCFESSGHFAGDDAKRIAALVETANDPSIDAMWFARGGYGACRVAEYAIPQLDHHARRKAWLGYSDIGFLLGGLYRAGFPRLAHGPMAIDARGEGGERAVKRAIDWLTTGAASSLERGVTPGHPNLAFNLAIFSQLLGTPLEPDLEGHVLMLEDLGEYMYRIDRHLFHITSNANVRRCAGIRLGRCLSVPRNEPEFGMNEEEVARFWCERSGIPYLGRADIGHDSDNKVVPFGRVPD